MNLDCAGLQNVDARERAIAGLAADREYLEAYARALRLRIENIEKAHAIARREIVDLSRKTAELEDVKRRLSKELAEELHANSSLRASWSWKITTPLRAAADIAGFLRGNPERLLVVARMAQWLRFRRMVRDSGIFDPRYYLKRYPEVARTRVDPLFHFFIFGAGELRQPHFLFDTRYYLAQNTDVDATVENPLVHYLRKGAHQGKNPHPDFDSAYYLRQNPDVREMGMNPLAHYLGAGTTEGCNPNRWFDTSAYLDQNPDLANSAVNPLIHHLAMKEVSIK